MGRNTGNKVFWTHAFDGTDHIETYYCQQHVAWDQGTSDTDPLANLKLHIFGGGPHGNVEQ